MVKLKLIRDIKLGEGVSIQVHVSDAGTVLIDYNAVSVCLRTSLSVPTSESLIEALDEANAHAAKRLK